MDELTQYLNTSKYYSEYKLEQILNKKIIITKNHIDHIKCISCEFNIIILFEQYGYIFTNEDYILLVKK